MVNCSVYGCKERSGGSYKLHTFPKDEQMRKKWTDACGRLEKRVGIDGRVCGKHFSESQFERNLMFELTQREGSKHYRGLKKNAVPDQNLPCTVISPSCQAKG